MTDKNVNLETFEYLEQLAKESDARADAKNYTLFSANDFLEEYLERKARREQEEKCQNRFKAILYAAAYCLPKTYGEKLRQFCKKAMVSQYRAEHGEEPPISLNGNLHLNYSDVKDHDKYVIDGVKQFLLSSPNVKLEQMTNLIDSVAPMAAFNSQDKKYSDYVKATVRGDKEFREELSSKRKAEARKSRETSHR